MTRSALLTVLLLAACRTSPELFYDVGIDPRNPSSIRINMQILHGPRSARVAMAVHPEYNDRYWRYIHDLQANGFDKRAILAMDRENVWRVISHAGSAQVGYRIELPPENATYRPVWHTAVRADGGSINAGDTFLYLPDFPRAPARIRIISPVPIVWDVAEENGGVMWSGSVSQEFETGA